MFGWFRFWRKPAKRRDSLTPPVQHAAETGRINQSPQEQVDQTAEISESARDFLGLLVSKEQPRDLHEFSTDSQLFLSAVVDLISRNQIEIPLLPRAALEISRLIEQPGVGAERLARVFESDPSLTIAVLQVANSVAMGCSHTTTSLSEAIVRLGLTRVHGLALSSHLSGKVLKAGIFCQEANLLSMLSLGMAGVVQRIAPGLSMNPDLAFTKAMLWHVEHLLVLNAVSGISARQRRQITPEPEMLHEAFFRFGAQLRELAAGSWNLKPLLIEAQDSEFTACMHAIRRKLVARWTGLKFPELIDADPNLPLDDALLRMEPMAPGIFQTDGNFPTRVTA